MEEFHRNCPMRERINREMMKVSKKVTKEM
jgi:hypothetical protein